MYDQHEGMQNPFAADNTDIHKVTKDKVVNWKFRIWNSVLSSQKVHENDAYAVVCKVDLNHSVHEIMYVYVFAVKF